MLTNTSHPPKTGLTGLAPSAHLNRRVAVLYVGVALLLTAAPAGAQQFPPALVTVAPVIQKEMPELITVVGTVEPARRSIAASQVAGLVTTMPVRQGDYLKKGQLICRLDNTSLQLEHRQAEAEQAAISEQIIEFKALFDQWAYEKKRVDTLYESNAANETEFRKITAEYTAAKQRLAQARHRLDAQQALIDRLADQLDKTTIRAPFAGSVVRLHTELGQWLARGGAVVELIDLSKVLVRIDAPAAVLPFVRCGQQCTVTIDGVDGQFVGKIKHIIRQADQLARTLPIEIELANEQGLIAAGMFAQANVPAGPTKTRLLVSRDAVVQRGQTRLVYVVKQQSQQTVALPVLVRLVGEYQIGVAIEAQGLAPGDRVVVRGNEQFLLMPPGPVPVVIPPMPPAPPGNKPAPTTPQPAAAANSASQSAAPE